MKPRPIKTALPHVTFWGAARTVTGSMHLLDAPGKRVLLDCGQSRGLNRGEDPDFPFEPSSVDAVILSHAHTDHCGNLAALVRQGFDGPIYCTAATRDVTAVMLADSARIQEERSVLTVGAGGRGAPDSTPFTRSDVNQTIDQCVTLEYERTQPLGDDIEFRLVNAGHLLGSAMVAMTIDARPRPRTLTFTGDLGRRSLPLHSPPSAVPPADLVITESTYGGKVHDTIERTTELLIEIIVRTMNRGGKVLIPAFSLGRTQLVLHVLQNAMAAGRLPAVDVFADSPLASEIVESYRAHPELLPDGYQDRPRDFLGGPNIHYVRSRDQSMELSERQKPCVIVASSGMCDAGRILHHLKMNIDDPRASICLVSFQAPATVGQRLLEKGPTVRFLNKTWNKWAEIYSLNGFSGHADQNDFMSLLGPIAGQVGKIRLVHGEPLPAAALMAGLKAAGYRDVAFPERGHVEAV